MTLIISKLEKDNPRCEICNNEAKYEELNKETEEVFHYCEECKLNEIERYKQEGIDYEEI